MKTLKKHLKQILTIVFIALSASSWAQNCSAYYPMTPGVSYEITHYDKKDKITSITSNNIVEASGNKATVHTVVTDPEGEETLNAEYDMICENDGVTIDFNSLIGKRMATEMKNSDVNVDISGKNFFLPNNLEKGMSLPDTDMEMAIQAGTMKMNFSAATTNRKVTGSETVTVPAGTFDCMIVESESSMKMLISKHTTTKSWIAKGVGVVKAETYKKNGKLDSKEVLTAFSK